MNELANNATKNMTNPYHFYFTPEYVYENCDSVWLEKVKAMAILCEMELKRFREIAQKFTTRVGSQNHTQHVESLILNKKVDRVDDPFELSNAVDGEPQEEVLKVILQIYENDGSRKHFKVRNNRRFFNINFSD